MRIALFLLWLTRCKFQVSEKRKNGRFVTSGTECRTLRLEPGPGRAIDQVSENLKFVRFRGECSAHLWVDVEILPKSWPARVGCKNNTTHSVFTCPENWHCMFWLANDLPPNKPRKISCILCGKVFKNKFKEDSHMKKWRFVLEYRSGLNIEEHGCWRRWLGVNPGEHERWRGPPDNGGFPRFILRLSCRVSSHQGLPWVDCKRHHHTRFLLGIHKGQQESVNVDWEKRKKINLIFSKAWIISHEHFSCETYNTCDFVSDLFQNRIYSRWQFFGNGSTDPWTRGLCDLRFFTIDINSSLLDLNIVNFECVNIYFAYGDHILPPLHYE